MTDMSRGRRAREAKRCKLQGDGKLSVRLHEKLEMGRLGQRAETAVTMHWALLGRGWWLVHVALDLHAYLHITLTRYAFFVRLRV